MNKIKICSSLLLLTLIIPVLSSAKMENKEIKLENREVRMENRIAQASTTQYRLENRENNIERIRARIASTTASSSATSSVKRMENLDKRLEKQQEQMGKAKERLMDKELKITEVLGKIADKIADIVGLKKDVLFTMLTQGFYKIHITEKGNINSEDVKISSDALNKIQSLVSDKESKISMVAPGEFEYRGDLTWHQIVNKLIRKGFEQDPEFEKHCESNSYKSHEEDCDCSDEKCGCDK